VPGCRAAANIEVHHIVPWSRGGAHALENLLCLCDGHHVAHHAGHITIEGPADAAVIVNLAAAQADARVHVEDRSDHVRQEATHVESETFHVESARRDAVLALTTLGFTNPDAARAVGAAFADEPASLEQLVRAALRRCPKPTA
jgi:hypothetical protein